VYKLTTRTWRIDKGDRVDTVDRQPGVVGYFPVVKRGMAPFIYESQCVTHNLETKMSGCFTFQCHQGPDSGKSFDIEVGEFQLRLGEGQQLFVTPQKYIESTNPAHFQPHHQ